MLADDLRENFEWTIGLIESVGVRSLREPYAKSLGDRLWELRYSGRDGIARSIYVTASQRRIVIVLTFVKKTRKTPPMALMLA